MKGFLKTILWTLLFSAIYFFSILVSTFSIAVYARITDNIKFMLTNSLGLTLFYGLILCILVYLSIFRRKLIPNFKKFESKEHLKYTLLMSVCTAVALFGLANFIILIVDTPINGMETLEQLSNDKSLYMIISIALLAPIVEEILCRGLIFGKAKEHVSLKTAIIFQALVFAIIHGNILQGSYAFFLGIIFAIFYVKTKTIWAPILLHILHNTFNVILGSSLPEALYQTPIYLLILGLIPIPFIVILLKKINNTNEDIVL